MCEYKRVTLKWGYSKAPFRVRIMWMNAVVQTEFVLIEQSNQYGKKIWCTLVSDLCLIITQNNHSLKTMHLSSLASLFVFYKVLFDTEVKRLTQAFLLFRIPRHCSLISTRVALCYKEHTVASGILDTDT